MKASLMTRLERLEQLSPVIDESKQIDRIILRGLNSPGEPPSIEYVLWTRPGFVEAANDT